MGTFIGAAAYFWRDIVRYIGAWFRSLRKRSVTDVDERLAWFIIIGTIPGALAGALFEEVIEKDLGQPWLIAVMLALFGVVLYFVDRRFRADREMADLKLRDVVIIGVAQALALQPGISRSGVTITAARGRGLERESAARFSFLLALPIIGGAGVLKTIEVASNGLPSGFAAPFLWGMAAAALVALLWCGSSSDMSVGTTSHPSSTACSLQPLC